MEVIEPNAKVSIIGKAEEFRIEKITSIGMNNFR